MKSTMKSRTLVIRWTLLLGQRSVLVVKGSLSDSWTPILLHESLLVYSLLVDWMALEDALKHPWVLNTLKMDRYLPWRTVLYGMDKYIRYNTFKQVVLQRMTHYLEGSFIEKINNTYDLITTKQDGISLFYCF